VPNYLNYLQIRTLNVILIRTLTKNIKLMTKCSYEQLTQYTKQDIALMDKIKLESSFFTNDQRRYIVSEILEIGGSSNKNKEWLVNTIIEGTHLLRNALIAQEKQLIESKEYEESLKKLRENDKRKALIESQENGIFIGGKDIYARFTTKDKTTNNKIFTYPKPLEIVSWVRYEYSQFNNGEGYSDNYLLGDKTTEFKNAIQELSEIINLEPTYKKEIIDAWHALNRPARENKLKGEKLRILENAKGKNTKLQNKTIDIVNWAIETIQKQPEKPIEIVYQSYAFSILTGRRLMEVFGTETQYKIIDNKFIYAEKLLKGSEDGLILTLWDNATFLVNFINNYSKKTYDATQEKNVSSYVNKRKPQQLLDLGLKTFKDCRDFHASVLKETYNHMGYKGESMTQIAMRHTNSESTKYYANFTIEPLPHLESLFAEYVDTVASELK
jgi:hypothetical protein